MHTIDSVTLPWLTIMILVALVAALVLWLVKPLHKVAKPYALVVAVIILGIFAAAMITDFAPEAAHSVMLSETYSWIPQIGVSIAWGLNGMGAVMVALIVFLVPIVLLAAWTDFDEAKTAGYFAWILALEAIMIGLFAARDVFLFYVLFEAMIVPMYFLIGRYGGEGRERAAMKFLIYSLVGGLIMLVGVIAVFAKGVGGTQGYMIDNLAGALNMTPAFEMLVFLTFFIAFAIKAPMWPVHTWLPDTTEKAPAGTSTLLVGVLDKLGTFGMIAICIPLFPAAAAKAAPVIIVLSIISIIWGAFMAISSDHLMRLIAYTSVSHFGFIVMGIFSGSSMAMSGAIVYMVAHGVGTAGLFLIVGFLGKRGNSYRISDYGGWQRVTPLIAGTFMVAGLAAIALPGLSGFIPEYLVLMGTYGVNKAAAIIAALGVVLAALYILLPYQRAFTGPKPEIEVQDLNGREKVVMGLLIAAMLWLGFQPGSVLNVVNPIADDTAVTLSTPVATLEGSNK